MSSATAVGQAVTDRMASQVWAARWDQNTGWGNLLPADQRELLMHTPTVVVDQPSPEHLHMIGASPSAHLLGLYTAGPHHEDALVQLFAAEIIALGYLPADVDRHEFGHVAGFNHTSRVATVVDDGVMGTVCNECTPRPQLPAHVHVPGSSNNCPVCRMEHHLLLVMGHLDGIRLRAHLQHQIPLGLGGLIVQCRRDLDEARTCCALATPMLPDRQGQMRTMSELIDQLGEELNGYLAPEDVSRAHATAYRAWDAAFDINHVFWLRALHGSAG